MILTQLVTGLADPEWEEKIMVLGDKLTLDKTVSLLEDLEMGKTSRANLKPGSVEQVGAVVRTDHQKVKMASKLRTDRQSVARPNKPVNPPFKCCGSKSHLSGIQERREKCTAFNVNF